MDVLPIGIVVIRRQRVNDKRRQGGGNGRSALVSNRKNALQVVTGKRQLFIRDLVAADSVDFEENLRQRRCGNLALNRR